MGIESFLVGRSLLFRSLGHRFGAGAAPCGSAFRTRVPRPTGFGLLPPRRLRVPTPKTSSLGNAAMPRLGSSAPLRPYGMCVPSNRAKGETPCRLNRPSPSSAPSSSFLATSRISKNGREYTAFGVSIISDRNLQAFHYNVVAFGKQGHFANPLQKGTRIKLVVQAQSQPDNIATLPLLTATFVRPVRPVAR